MKIHGMVNIISTVFEEFDEELRRETVNLQDDGQEVEIQTHTNTLNSGIMVYNALILGRKGVRETNNLRKCIIANRTSAYFHRWSDKSQVVSPSPMIGGHGGGIICVTVGIVEHEDGTIHECYPHEIRFLDRIECENKTRLKVGNTYVLNEDIKSFINLKDDINPKTIKAGTICTLIEMDGDYVTIDVDGLKIRTEDHMLDGEMEMNKK